MAALHGVEQGEGPTVCLLHGLFGRSLNFATLARRLALRFRVVALDLRNHGASPHAAEMDYAVMAQDVLETLDACGALPAGVLGHSMGGKVAMTMALTAAPSVSRLLVADIAPVAYHHANAAVARALQELALPPGLDRRTADAALSTVVVDPGIRGFLLQNLITGNLPGWRIGLDEIAAALPALEGWPDLPPGARYDGPALFVAGERSDYVGPAGIAAIATLFPHAEVEHLAGAGHWLHADQPDAFAALAEDFFGG